MSNEPVADGANDPKPTTSEAQTNTEPEGGTRPEDGTSKSRIEVEEPTCSVSNVPTNEGRTYQRGLRVAGAWKDACPWHISPKVFLWGVGAWKGEKTYDP